MEKMEKTKKFRNQTKKGMEFARKYAEFIKSGRAYSGLVALLEDTNLSCQARILFHIISSFSYVEGYCYATNETLASRLGLKKTMLKQYLNELITNEIIDCEIMTGSSGIRREIYINFNGLKKRYKSL